MIRELAGGLRLDPFTWVLLVFAASLGGAGIAYLAIGDWIRWPLTKEVPHSSNKNIIEIEPKYEGWLNSPGVLLCCPICAGTWVGAALLGLMALDYGLGYYTVLALAIGGGARIVTRLAEFVEWQGNYAKEMTAKLNRENALDEAQMDWQALKDREEQREQLERDQKLGNPAYDPVTKGVWVVKDDGLAHDAPRR